MYAHLKYLHNFLVHNYRLLKTLKMILLYPETETLKKKLQKSAPNLKKKNQQPTTNNQQSHCFLFLGSNSDSLWSEEEEEEKRQREHEEEENWQSPPDRRQPGNNHQTETRQWRQNIQIVDEQSTTAV